MQDGQRLLQDVAWPVDKLVKEIRHGAAQRSMAHQGCMLCRLSVRPTNVPPQPAPLRGAWGAPRASFGGRLCASCCT